MECQATYNRMKLAGVSSQCTQALASLLGGMYMERLKLTLHQDASCS